MNNAPNPNTTSLGMDGNLAALLSYIIGIIGIIILITEKENKFAKYHALQALWFTYFNRGFLHCRICFADGLRLYRRCNRCCFRQSRGNNRADSFGCGQFILWIALIVIGPLLAIGGNDFRSNPSLQRQMDEVSDKLVI